MPKLLWISPYSLHDKLSNAALNCKLLLEGLVKIGWSVYVCSALNGEECDELDLIDLRQKYGAYGQHAITFCENDINYVYTCGKTTQESQMCLKDMDIFYELYCSMLDLFSPDFVMGYGFNPSMVNCFAEAKRRGCSTIFMLLNANYCNFSFPHIDLILTNSRENAYFYATRAKVNALPIGEVFATESTIKGKIDPQYITFVNPDFGTGMSIFAKIAMVLQKLEPSQRFLVVNRHKLFEPIVRRLKIADSEELDKIDCQSFFAPTQATLDPSNYFTSHSATAFATEATTKDRVSEEKKALPAFHAIDSFDFTHVRTLTYEEEQQGNLRTIDPNELANVDVTEPDIDLAQVYAQTKVILMPTLTWDSWGRVATEAILNNIPVVASTSGGLIEATFGAGLHLTPPLTLQKQINVLPSNAEIKPWIDAINCALHGDLSAHLQKARQQQVLEDSLERFQEAISSMMRQQLHTRISFNQPEQWLGYTYPKHGHLWGKSKGSNFP